MHIIDMVGNTPLITLSYFPEEFPGVSILAKAEFMNPSGYLINDACVLLGKPNVYGSIFQFEGQASVFYAKAGPCYRCRYLSQQGIAVRSGHHCAQPILRHFGYESTVRPSLAFYNTPQDIDFLAEKVAELVRSR